MLHSLIVAACCLFFLGIQTNLTHAAETRGLRVVAKDPASGQTGEVKLYNKSYAVIIGIDKYPNLPHDRQLAYAVKDAQGVEQVMRRLYKFDKIVTLYDQQATRDRILDLLTEELPAVMGEDDSLFIFWAGHGNQEKSREGELGYLIPYDGSPAKIRTNITMAEIRDTISKKIPAKHIFYVMDACYSGLMTATRAVDTKPRRDLSYLKEITKERVRQVLTAGSKDQEVLDGGQKGHSIFTGRLIEALEATGDFVTANEIQAILKEKVYGDAKARNHTQTPGYGTLYGNGDYVFVPSRDYQMQQLKAEQDKRQQEIDRTIKEQEKINREMAEIAALEQKAKEAANERDLRKAEDAKRAAEAKLAQQRLRQQALENEKRRNAQEQAELKRIDDERKRQLDEARQMQAKYQQDNARQQNELQRLEQVQLKMKREEEQKLAEMRKLAEERRKKALEVSAGALSLDAAVAEIRSANARIDEIRRQFGTELDRQKTSAKSRLDAKLKLLKQNHDQRMASLKNQKVVLPVRPVVAPKDEFETDTEYKARKERTEADYQQRLTEARSGTGKIRQAEEDAYNKAVQQVEESYRAEVAQFESSSTTEQQAAIQPFQERIATLSSQEYTLPSDSLLVELGQYDAEKQLFPVSIKNKPQMVTQTVVDKKTHKKTPVKTTIEPYVKVAVNSTIPLPRGAARSFKQQWQAGAVRAQVVAKTGTGEVQKITLVNDSDGVARECRTGSCMTVLEYERLGLIYTDPQTGLQWLREGNVASREMNWYKAMEWVKTLRVGGYSDWRLPTKDELSAFIKQGGQSPASYFNASGFRDVQPMFYWSSSPYHNYANGAWNVDLGGGYVDYSSKIYGFYVWPVRDAKEARPQSPAVGSTKRPMEIDGI